ncbi:MAG: hypothetical protein AAF218_07285 [Pseudomonadota bacterium]
MSAMTLTPIGLKGGVWSAMLSGGEADAPVIRVMHEDRSLEDVTVSDRGSDGWLVQVPVPSDLLSDGVQTFLVLDSTDAQLGHFSVLAGAGIGHDIRAEVALLRGELDLLKRAFRRHCSEAEAQS